MKNEIVITFAWSS